MSKIYIEGKEYNYETLTPAIKEHLVNLQAADAELKEVTKQFEIVQSARDNYAKALRDLIALSELLHNKEQSCRSTMA